MKTVLITGGAGYVGAALTPKLLKEGYKVKVLDLMIYGEDVLDNHENLEKIKGDIRDQDLLKHHLKGVDSVIHLACISNDPSFDLNPDLGKSINLNSFRPLVEISKESGVQRFIYASSSSVYGIKDEKNVDENMMLEPLTDYSKFKAECEKILIEYQDENFTTVTIRPATVCGYSRRQRLDVIVNILSNHAYHNRKIKVFGGNQLRPNIHIKDMINLYSLLLKYDKKMIAGKIFNVGHENHTVMEIANMVKEVVGNDVSLDVVSTDDNRSYHISSSKIKKELDFSATHSIVEAVEELQNAFKCGLLPNSMEDDKYYNIKTMLKIKLQ